MTKVIPCILERYGNMKKWNLVLASASPRREEILKNHNIEPIIIPSLDPEILPEDLKATCLPEKEQEKVDRGAVEYLAMVKAKSVAEEILRTMEFLDLTGESTGESLPKNGREESLRKAAELLKQGDSLAIIGADTLVFKGEKFGKPKQKEEAFRMLKTLQGSSHKVITGVAILFLDLSEGKFECTSETWTSANFSCETVVRFKEVPDGIIADYVETAEPYDKAGGYAIQGYFGQFVEGFDGDFENVIGLPFSMIEEYLTEALDLVNFK